MCHVLPIQQTHLKRRQSVYYSLTQITPLMNNVQILVAIETPGGKRNLNMNIRSFLNKIFSPKPPVHSCSKKILFFCIPYTGQHGLQIRTQLYRSFSSAYLHISIRFVFRPTCRLSDFFPFKDRIPFAMRSHVVYKYKCQCCGALYVGQTRRHIHTRISEHMGVSSKTGNKLSVWQMSAVLTDHHLSGHNISDSDFTILTSGNSKFDLEMRESLLISKLKPILNNNNISSMPLNLS